MRDRYVAQVRLLVDVLPDITAESAFALKGGTAINLFYRDMPRLSVDIDLTWLPISDRSSSLREIDSALDRIATSIVRRNPGITARRASGGGGSDTRIVVTRGRVQIKIETSPVARGTVLPPRTMVASESVTEQFGFVEMNVLSFEDLYAGKLVAALDRRHPRDLFDVKLLYENEGLTDDLFRVFMVYVASSRRPMHELLAPALPPRGDGYDTEFAGMVRDPVSPEALLETGRRLHADVGSRLTGGIATFLLSLHDAEPDFGLIGLPEAADLPAVRWKLLNLQRLRRASFQKHAEQRGALEQLLRYPAPRQRYPTEGELSSALAERAEAVCRHYLPHGTKNGAYWHAGSPAGEKGRSMYVHLAGALRGKWMDVATDTRGDLLDLIRLNQGHATLNAAKDEAVRFLGGGLTPVDPPSPAPSEPAPDTDNAARLARFFASASPIGEDDAGARYLVSRGLSPAHAQALRFHPRTYVKMGEETETHPALLAPIRTPAGELEGLHRIFLTPEGGPAPIAGHKRTSGALGAGGVWFGNPGAARVAVCEGVEDALTVLAALPPETHQRIGIVASMSAARIDKVALAPETRELVLLQDRDAAGERAWAALNARYAGSAVSVSRVLPTGGKDLNESLLALGPEALREQLAAFVPFTPAEQASNAFIAFRDDWNHFIKRAGEDGVHPFYQEGYSALTARRAPLSELPHQSTEAREALTKADRWHHEQHIAQRDIVRLIKALDSHDRNYGVLKSAADLGGYGVENTTAYPAWRERRKDLATEGEQRLAESRYTHHLDNITGARERLEKVVAEHRERVRRIVQLSNEPSPDDPGHRPRRSRGISPV